MDDGVENAVPQAHGGGMDIDMIADPTDSTQFLRGKSVAGVGDPSSGRSPNKPVSSDPNGHLPNARGDPKGHGDLQELMAVLQRDEREEICEAHVEILSIIKALGGNQSKYRRERRRAVRAIVSEVY